MNSGFSARSVAAAIISDADRDACAFPRNVEFAALALPTHIEFIDQLTPDKIDRWLHSHLAWATQASGDNRRIRGCLVAHRGRAIIFVEASESEDERRFTVSHELAHFIGHYLAGRELAIARLGEAIVAVLDGDRPPTPAERLSGVLLRCPLGVFRDVLDRDGGEPLSEAAERMEVEADTAAFLALAPPAEVVARCDAIHQRRDRECLLQTLQSEFGLAFKDALHHLPVVLKVVRRQTPSLVESLKSAAGASEKRSGRSI